MKAVKLLIAGALALSANFALASGMHFMNNTQHTFTPECTGPAGPVPPIIKLGHGPNDLLTWNLLNTMLHVNPGDTLSCKFKDESGDVMYSADVVMVTTNSGKIINRKDPGRYKVSIDPQSEGTVASDIHIDIS